MKEEILKLISEKTQTFTGNGEYFFKYIDPLDCIEIITSLDIKYSSTFLCKHKEVLDCKVQCIACTKK